MMKAGFRGALLLCGVAASLGMAAGARAGTDATSDAGPDKGLTEAKDAFEAAQNAFVRGEYDKAAARFLEAYEKKPYPAFLFNVAVSYEKAKLLEKAKEYFERYLKVDPNASDAAQVKARLDVIAQLLAPPPAPVPLPAAPPPTGAPPVAGTAPVPGAPVPGETPAASAGSAAPGSAPVAGISPASGAPPTAVAPLPASAPPPVLPDIDTKGLIVIDSKPQGATIYLNDKRTGPFGKTPWHGSLESKPVRLLLESKGYKPEERAISPRPDKLIDVYIALSEEHYLGWIEIVSNVPGADVFIDRKDIGAIGRTPFTGQLKPGKHTVYLEKFGWQATQQEIDVPPGTATQHTLTMPPSQSGWITITGRTTAGGRLVIDEKFGCATPCRAEIAPGKHKILVEKKGMEDYETDLELGRGIETAIEVQMSPRPPRTRAISTSIVALVFIGAGAYVGHLSQQAKDGLDSDIANHQLIDNNDPRFLRGKVEAIGADVLYGLGAIIAATAVYGLLEHGPDSTGVAEHKAISFAPVFGPDGAGLAFSGSF
ncbi:MAG TPA: PEGA domain-containing protein [Polyangia bacterium]|nr:PEGA domain-containing protein [Polyangia bacterium]